MLVAKQRAYRQVLVPGVPLVTLQAGGMPALAYLPIVDLPAVTHETVLHPYATSPISNSYWLYHSIRDIESTI
jgi:hypothetical protein